MSDKESKLVYFRFVRVSRRTERAIRAAHAKVVREISLPILMTELSNQTKGVPRQYQKKRSFFC